ncbi:DUF1127 domain-containing protein [Ruegeria sp. A3M17]|uniref:DUF1127 domain-containing protein n=1 Tax=Ruegeria sp. A3M17 TaxID=2267229 RepID=UPI000DE82616|nr:hypothetical protein DS906_08650 [Ruegeria sp. A3M17]
MRNLRTITERMRNTRKLTALFANNLKAGNLHSWASPTAEFAMLNSMQNPQRSRMWCLMNWVAMSRRRYKDARHLRALPDYLLSDVGLSRPDIDPALRGHLGLSPPRLEPHQATYPRVSITHI